jgi:hypothetical protein
MRAAAGDPKMAPATRKAEALRREGEGRPNRFIDLKF